MDDDEYFDLSPQAQFNLSGNDVDQWLYKAIALFDSAKSLANSFCYSPEDPEDLHSVLKWIELHGVFRMLYGMAFECLFKTLWLVFGNTLVSNGKYRGIPETRDHDLCSLERKVFENVDSCLNDEERKILARLSFFITSGRYPIRKSVSERYPKAPEDDKPVYWCRWTIDDYELLKGIEDKLMGLIEI